MLSPRNFIAGSLAMVFVAALATIAEAKGRAASDQALLASVSLSNQGGCCGQPACCPKPCITYRHRGPKLCCGCEPGIETVLKVKDPCTCCEVDVPVCLPACCQGEPKVCVGTGFLGRDIVEYEWCCGFSVRVAFKHNGDLIVTTWGR
ncbi:MAG TPA: hypothetical protein VL175_16320 [Pirellulales bacterium]|nr:hypothetical protein [Pirellulales bacterium]